MSAGLSNEINYKIIVLGTNALNGILCVEIKWKKCIQNDWVEQWMCIKFFIQLEHSSTETIRMIQKATTGDWHIAYFVTAT